MAASPFAPDERLPGQSRPGLWRCSPLGNAEWLLDWMPALSRAFVAEPADHDL